MPHAHATALLQRLRRLLDARAGRAGQPSSEHRATAPNNAGFHPIVLPGGHARFRSIALPMIACWCWLQSWLSASATTSITAVRRAVRAEQRARAERGASTVEASILDDFRGVEQAARTLQNAPTWWRAQQCRHQRRGPPVGAAHPSPWRRHRRRDLRRARQLIDRVGDPGRYRLTGDAEADAVAQGAGGW